MLLRGAMRAALESGVSADVCPMFALQLHHAYGRNIEHHESPLRLWSERETGVFATQHHTHTVIVLKHLPSMESLLRHYATKLLLYPALRQLINHGPTVFLAHEVCW